MKLKNARQEDSLHLVNQNVFTESIVLAPPIYQHKLFLFLDASLHLYKRVCPSVGPSFHPSVHFASSNIMQMTHRVARLALFDCHSLVGSPLLWITSLSISSWSRLDHHINVRTSPSRSVVSLMENHNSIRTIALEYWHDTAHEKLWVCYWITCVSYFYYRCLRRRFADFVSFVSAGVLRISVTQFCWWSILSVFLMFSIFGRPILFKLLRIFLL